MAPVGMTYHQPCDTGGGWGTLCLLRDDTPRPMGRGSSQEMAGICSGNAVGLGALQRSHQQTVRSSAGCEGHLEEEGEFPPEPIPLCFLRVGVMGRLLWLIPVQSLGCWALCVFSTP